MSFSENKGLWLMTGGVALAVVALIWIVASARPLRLVVIYDDVGGLKREDPVIWRRTNIGKVEQIKPSANNRVGVTVRIREDYASKITHGAEFVLRKASFFGLIGDNAIEVVTTDASGTPFKSGEEVRGIEAVKPTLLEEGREYWRRLKEETSQLIDELKASPYRKEAGEALDQLQSLAEEGSKAAKEGLDSFKKSHQKDLDEALKKLERLRDEMRRKGDAPDALRIEREIDRVKGKQRQ